MFLEYVGFGNKTGASAPGAASGAASGGALQTRRGYFFKYFENRPLCSKNNKKGPPIFFEICIIMFSDNNHLIRDTSYQVLTKCCKNNKIHIEEIQECHFLISRQTTLQRHEG